MKETKFGRCFVTELKTGVRLPAFRHGEAIEDAKPGLGDRKHHVLWVDDDVVPGSFYSEYLWFFPGQDPTSQRVEKMGPEPHVHPFDEVIAFVGTNQDDLFDLGGEVELWLEDRRFNLTRSFLVYVPAGMKHCPLRVKRVDRPIFQYVLGSDKSYGGTKKEGESEPAHADLARQFVFEYKKNLVHPAYRAKGRDEPGRHVHILYLDAEVMPKANFYVEASWFGTAPRPTPVPGQEPTGPEPHVHPFPEIITFFGTNPDDVHDLGGEVELWIENEQHVLTRSFVAYIPGGVIHCPIFIRHVERPIFHFTAGPGTKYE